MNDYPTREAKALADAYAALNRNDLDGFVAPFDPAIVRIEPAGHATAGTFHGIDAVRAHIAQGRGTWAEGTCEPTRFLVAGDRVIVFLHVHVRLRGATDWIGGDMADVFTFRDGKAIEFRTFWEPPDALAYAGVPA